MLRQKHLGRVVGGTVIVAIAGCEGIVGVDFDHVPMRNGDAVSPSAAPGADVAIDAGSERANPGAPPPGGGLARASSFRRLAAGAHTCAITPDSRVKCWGDGAKTPTPIEGLTDAVSVAVGGTLSCAITTSGTAKCWGKIAAGYPPVERWSSAVPVSKAGLDAGVKDIALGFAHGCAVTGSEVGCWGDGTFEQLGRAVDFSDTPIAVSIAAGALAISAAPYRSCALVARAAKAIPVCWGSEWISPNLAGLGDVTAIAAGAAHTCVLTSATGVKCWGSNMDGQLGSGMPTGRGDASDIPVDVKGLAMGAKTITAGSDHSCALTTKDEVKCWGSGRNGEIGNVDGLANEPVHVPLSGVIAIAAGYRHTCAMTNAGAVHCWGANDHGQLGSPSAPAQSFTPVEVVGFP